MTENKTRRGNVFVCRHCGTEFFVPQYEINYRPAIKYCSQECYHASTVKPKVMRSCLFCGTEFAVGSKHKDKKFCCLKCAQEHRKASDRVPTLGANGYKYVWFSDGSGEKEHRYIMEQHLGRKLDADEVVHHIDGDRANNDLSNLLVMSRGEHSSLHRKQEIQAGKVMFGGDSSADQQPKQGREIREVSCGEV